MTVGRERIGRTLRELVLTVGAVLGVLAILVGIGVVVFGLRPLVFRSGSMSPTIGTGALAIAHDVAAEDLRVGDVVSVPTQGGDLVTHRIVSVDHEQDGRAVLRLRGDANSVDDAESYDVTHADRVLFSVPKLGYAVGWLSGSTGRFLLGLYAAFLLMVIFRRSPSSPDSGPDGGSVREQELPPPLQRTSPRRGSEGTGTAGTALLVSLAMAGLLVSAVQVTPTWAAWTNPGNLTGTTFTSYAVPAPVMGTCSITSSGQNRTITFTWTGVTSPATTYAGAVGSGIVTSSATIGGTASAPTYVVAISVSNGSGNRGKSASVTITPSLTATPSWTGPAAVGSIAVDGSGNASCS